MEDAAPKWKILHELAGINLVSYEFFLRSMLPRAPTRALGP